MRKALYVLIIVIIITISAYYYFFVHFQDVKSRELLELVDSYVESGITGPWRTQVKDVSDLDYYRGVCSFDYQIMSNYTDPKTGSIELNVWMNNVNCNWDGVNELLFEVPENDLTEQYLYSSLSNTNAYVKILNGLFSEKVNRIYSEGGLSFWASNDILAFFMLISSTEISYLNSVIVAGCWQEYNRSLDCLPDFVEVKSKINIDLINEIDFGRDFVSSCSQHNINSIHIPEEAITILKTRSRADCEYIAGIYKYILDEVRNDDEIDPNTKFTVLSTLYVTSGLFKGQDETEIRIELNNMYKEYADQNYMDFLNQIESYLQ